MKLTKSKLKEIIREELLNEQSWSPKDKKDLLKTLTFYQKMMNDAIKEVKFHIKGKADIDDWFHSLDDIGSGISAVVNHISKNNDKFN